MNLKDRIETITDTKQFLCFILVVKILYRVLRLCIRGMILTLAALGYVSLAPHGGLGALSNTENLNAFFGTSMVLGALCAAFDMAFLGRRIL